MDSIEHRQDVVFTTEKHEEGWRISAHELSYLGSSTATRSRTIYASTQPIQLLKAVDEGAIIIAASEERVLLGSLRSADFGTVDKIKYEFRIFESTNAISSLDARVSKRGSGTKLDKVKVVDVVVGDVKGAIFVHNDLLRNLIGSQKSTANDQHPISLIPRKLHWHRKAVNCVKWSLDGLSCFIVGHLGHGLTLYRKLYHIGGQ
jgi:NET1-associated nuclear protein 1 (U3 small nucleolar RNA-associated protein 17)